MCVYVQREREIRLDLYTAFPEGKSQCRSHLNNNNNNKSYELERNQDANSEYCKRERNKAGMCLAGGWRKPEPWALKWELEMEQK